MNLIPKLKWLLPAAALLFSSFNAGAADDVRVPENRVIYEVFVRNFSPEGNFAGVERQIPRLKELGVDVIWLMPIYKLGDIGKWGTYSSPYAVKNYKAIDPDNGTEAQLRSLVNTIHANGMEIWFDWVGNHTSKDNVWVTSHPEYYGNSFTSPNGWSDVYQLDINNSAMHDAMIDAMQYWVTEFDIDGYRCDYASGPSEEFWRKATSRVLKNGQRIAWLAEDDSKPALVSKGYFDYNYAWYFHDRLRDFARGANLNTLRNECRNLHTEAAYNGRSRMVYLSNHDVVQDEGGTEDKLFGKYLRPLTVLEFTIYGMPLLYNGQEIQYKSGKVLLSEKTPIDWSNPDTEMTNLIKTLCYVKHTQPALRTGAQHGSLTNLVTSNDNNIYAYKRTLGDNNVVVMLNFSDSQQSFTIANGLPSGVYADAFSGRAVDFDNPGTFTLPGRGYAVYVSDAGTNIEPVEPHYIYVEDKTGWSESYIYAYNEERNEVEGAAPLGVWPGARLEGEYNIDGHTFKRALLPASMQGHDYTFIVNNNSGSQLDDIKVDKIDGDHFLYDVALPTGSYTLYVINDSPFSPLYVYAWGSGELFGAWPGTRSQGVAEIGGVAYETFKMPAGTGSYNLIFNNGKGGDGNQVNSVGLTPDSDKYIRLNADLSSQYIEPGERTYTIYVEDRTDWSALYVYAYADDKPVMFGAWPGAKGVTTETIGGVTYYVFKYTAFAGTFNLIFHDGAGTQYDADGNLPADRDYFLVASSASSSVGQIAADEDVPVTYYNLQGMRVDNPHDGIFIEVRGTQVRKMKF